MGGLFGAWNGSFMIMVVIELLVLLKTVLVVWMMVSLKMAMVV